MFIVDYEALDSLKESIIGQKSQNDLVLEGIKSALRELRDTQVFTGVGADSIKSYISPSDGIYGTIFNALDQITQTQKDAVLLYCFYYFLYVDNSDAYLQTYINTDEIEGIRQTLVNSTTSASDHANSILSELNAINDIYSHEDISSIENLMGYIEYDSNDASNTIIELQNNIEAVETAGLITLMQSAVEQAISDLLNLLDGLYSQNRTSSIDFSHTDMLMPQITAVQNSSQALFDLRCACHGDIQSARDYSAARVEGLQYIDEAASERLVSGIQGIIVDGMIIVGGVALILGTGGIGAIPGGGMIIYGTSNFLQHSQDVYYGLRGEIYTSSVNPVCEVYFDGDETLYNLAGQVCVITSVFLIMPPVTAAVVLGSSYCSGEIAVYSINYLRTSSGMEPLSNTDAQWVRIGVDTIVSLGAYHAMTRISEPGLPYEIVYEADVGTGTSRTAHRNSANTQFYNAMRNDPIFRQQMNEFFGYDVMEYMQSGRTNNYLNPRDYVWHHPADNPDALQLISRSDHQCPAYQPILHPGEGGEGGFGIFYSKKEEII
ncbi:DNase/tRNase domain of colicin-like bacteriocin [Ruminococcaceae bacterium KH2T8]|nr:DNase/tRNase domain of colicin-like bacteriocin [Ruminococcaceae bacterium KH2T8]